MFFGEPGPWFNQLDMDGDKTSLFHDVDGSVSEYPGSYLTKDDNWLVRHPECIHVPDWRGAICSGRYAQVGDQGAPGATHPTPRSCDEDERGPATGLALCRAGDLGVSPLLVFFFSFLLTL